MGTENAMKRFVCIFLICILLVGCAGGGRVQRQIWAMDTYMSLEIWGADAQSASEKLEDMLYTMEKDWSVTEPDSVIHNPKRANEQQKTFLQEVENLSIRTGGCFDPYLGSLTQVWGFLTKQYRVPSPEEIALALQDKQLDLGGAVKGYAARQAVEILENARIDRALLNLGGNIQTYGNKADGSPWNIGIQNPDGGELAATIQVEGTWAVVTSGDYQRYFEHAGKRYHHIFDPATGYPAQTDLRSVTVICADGLTADVLSTALFAMGSEKAAAFWRSSDDFEAVLILADGSIQATQGAKLTDCKYEVIHR